MTKLNEMKHLITLYLALVSVASWSQLPSLPYNSDWNNNGIIEVVDLMQLLSDYGELFSSAVISENEESAIIYMGDMPYPHCEYSCSQLPGFWRMPQLKDLVPVWSEVFNANAPITWLYGHQEAFLEFSGAANFPVFRGHSNSSSSTLVTHWPASSGVYQNYRCYCTAKQMPRVEYTACASNDYDGLISCASNMVAAGWYPLDHGPQFKTTSEIRYSQAFWRWVD